MSCLDISCQIPKSKLTTRVKGVKKNKHILRYSVTNDAYDMLRQKQSSTSADRQVRAKKCQKNSQITKTKNKRKHKGVRIDERCSQQGSGSRK